ncbi:MAG TPA: hypothetical protein VFG20_08895, partial [Planctomycetaceae bacterium]|nr:hypothetical protein [Planctomycetaceae bacterium]
SEWLNNVQQLRPQLAGDVNSTVSLSMLEQWHRWTLDQPSEPDRTERTTLQEFLAANDAQGFLKWGDSQPANLHVELQFARSLASPSAYAWQQIQQALRVRSIAEELACHPVAVRWFAEDLLRGDRLRWYGERKLSDPVQGDDSATAHQALREAESIYHQIAAATERLSAAHSLEVDLLADLPHWMALSRNQSLAIRPALSTELLPLIGDLREFIELLANANAQDCGRVEQLRHGLQARRDRISALLFPQTLFGEFVVTETPAGELRLHAGALLETPLPTASQRQLLQKFVAHPPITPSGSPAEMPNGNDPVAVLVPDDELEGCFARLLQPLQWHSDGKQHNAGRWAFPSVVSTSLPGPEQVRRSDEAAPWCQAYVALPGELRKHLRDPSSAESTARAWQHTFPLIDPRDELPLVVERHITALLLADMQRVIHWQWQQATLAQSDTTTREAARLQEQIDHLSSLLTNSFGVSRPVGTKDSVCVSSPGVVDLAVSPDQTLLLTVQNPQHTVTQVRYVVEYDPALLDVQTAQQHCQLVTRVPRAESHIWPYEADHPPEPTCELASEGQDELSLKVRGRQSEGPTRLVVHIVTDRCSVRQDIVVNLPQRPLASVQVRASRNEQLIVADQELRPFGNRSTAYHFSVLGLRRESHPLDITAYRVTVPTVSWPTAMTLPTADLQRWLSQTSGIQELAGIAGVAVKPDVSVPLRFPAVKPEANASLDVCGGFLIVMHDATRQLSTWQHLPCTPLRPAAYVDAAVQYDDSRETLRIAVRGRDEME